MKQGSTRRSPFMRLYENHTQLHDAVESIFSWLEGREREEVVLEAFREIGPELARTMRRQESDFIDFFEEVSDNLIPEANVYEMVVKGRCTFVKPPHQIGPKIFSVHKIGEGILSESVRPSLLESHEFYLGEILRPKCVRCKELGGGDPTHPTEISFKRKMPVEIAGAVHELERAKENILRLETQQMALDSESGIYIPRSKTEIVAEIRNWELEKSKVKSKISSAHSDIGARMAWEAENPQVIESDCRIKSVGSLRDKVVDYVLASHLERRGILGPYEFKMSHGRVIKQVEDLYAGKLIVPWHEPPDSTEEYGVCRRIMERMKECGATITPGSHPQYVYFEPKNKPTYQGVKVILEANGIFQEWQIQTPEERELDRGTHKIWKLERKGFLDYAREMKMPVDELLAVAEEALR